MKTQIFDNSKKLQRTQRKSITGYLRTFYPQEKFYIFVNERRGKLILLCTSQTGKTSLEFKMPILSKENS